MKRLVRFPSFFSRFPQGKAGRSLRTQLIFWNVLSIAVLLGGLGIGCRFILLATILHSVDQDLERSVQGVMRRPQWDHCPNPPKEGQRAAFLRPGHLDKKGQETPNRNPDNPYPRHIFNADGTSETPEDTRPPWDISALTRSLQGVTVHETIRVNGAPLRLLSKPKPDYQGRMGVVQTVYPLKEVTRVLSGLDTGFLILLPIGLLGAWWVGQALTQRILRQMQHLTQAAGRIDAKSFDERLPISGDDEFAAMAETFNGLLGRLEASYREQMKLLERHQRFTADASHELKTPLTIIKGNAGLALSRTTTDDKSRRGFQQIARATETMVKLVQDLLFLARLDEGKERTEWTELQIQEVLEIALARTNPPENVAFTQDIAREELTVRGNEEELIRLFRNLIDNAIHYTPPGECVHLTARKEKTEVIVTVEDTGEGIAPEHLPHLGERFYRVDASRTRPTGGTGLGLSICKSIVAAHGGTLIFASTFGEGATVRVALPCSNSEEG